jgi:hypothetical protein
VRTTGARIDSSAHMKRPFTVRSLAWLAYAIDARGLVRYPPSLLMTPG